MSNIRVSVALLITFGSALSAGLVLTGDEHLVWLPEARSELASILRAEHAPNGALMARATTEQLKVLTERQIPFMVISRDQFQALQGERPVAKSEAPLPPLLTHQKVAIIADDAAYQMCESQLLTYEQDVEARFDAELTIYHGTWPTAESLRQFIKALWTADQITGAIQVGYLPYAMWEFPWAEVCPIPLFHEDMDATFLDRDGDGKYDWHVWGPNDGPEVWTAYLRPAQGRLSDLNPFFDKCHNYYQDTLTAPKRAEVCICRDWGNCVEIMRNALAPIYGDSIHCDGGPGVPVPGRAYLDALARGYELIDLWVHSSSTYHQFDTVPNEGVYDSAVRATIPGAMVTMLSACHVMDWHESPTHYFAEARIFNNGIGLANIGCTRSAGLTETEWLFAALADSLSLAEAYAGYLNSIYDTAFIHRVLPSETLECFVYDVALFGNPFWTTRPVGVSESGSEPFKQDAIEPRPSIFAGRVRIEVRCTTADAPTVAVYDKQGRFVRRLACSGAESGLRTFSWDGTDDNRRVAPSGVYFARVQAGDFTATRKMVKTD
jgi:hypothetical protein